MARIRRAGRASVVLCGDVDARVARSKHLGWPARVIHVDVYRSHRRRPQILACDIHGQLHAEVRSISSNRARLSARHTSDVLLGEMYCPRLMEW